MVWINNKNDPQKFIPPYHPSHLLTHMLKQYRSQQPPYHTLRAVIAKAGDNSF